MIEEAKFCLPEHVNIHLSAMARINFTPFPVLMTERLILRQLADSDAEVIFRLRTNDSVNQFIERTIPAKIEEAQAFIQNINEGISQNRGGYWAICLRDDDDLVGTICLFNFSEDKLTVEVGYELFPGFQGQGIMSEALRKIISFAFDTLEFETLEAFTHKDNIHSSRLLVRHKFELSPGRIDEGNESIIVYVLKKSTSEKLLRAEDARV